MKTEMRKLKQEEMGRHCKCGKIAYFVDIYNVYRCFVCMENLRLAEDFRERSKKDPESKTY